MRLAVDARKLTDYGIGTYVRGLVGALAEHRADWEIVLIGDPDASGWSPPASARWVVERSRGYGLAELTRVGAAATTAGADLFHAPHYVFPLRLGCPGVVTIHDCIHLRFPDQLPRPLGFLPRRISCGYARWMMRHACRAAREVITVSAAAGEDLATRVGVPGTSVTAILNGCDPFWSRRDGDEETPGAGSPEHADPLRLPDRYVLWVGNPKPHKNLPRLLRAFASVRARIPDLWLLLAGTAESAGETEGVRALGRVSDHQLRRLYQGATLLAIPSLYEGFGLPAAEAMAAGTPVVYGAAGGLPEVVGAAGVAVDPLDEEAIAGGLRRVLEDDAFAATAARRGRARARQLSWARCAAETARVYERALEGS